MRLPRRSLPLAALLLTTCAAAGVLLLAWVPDGQVLLCGHAIRSPGLRLAPRWRPRALFPVRADLKLEGVRVELADGGFQASVGLHVETNPAALQLDAAR